MNEKLRLLRKKAMALPMQPGVYIMKNKDKKIIYIGKAKKLKNRVSQYFGSQNNHTEKIRRMVSNVDDFEYIITDSEFESLILECSLIKQHKPKYNILLKDDKGYSYIRVSDELWRRIDYVLQKGDDSAKYIGPYKSSFYVKTSVEEAMKIFMLPTCNKKFPDDFKKGRPCLNFHIKQCCAPCTGRVSLKEYNERVDEALAFLQGGSAKTLKKLNESMQDAAERLDFESAARYRDTINAVKRMRDKQKVVNINIDEIDVIAVCISSNKGSATVLRFSDSRMFDKENFIVSDVDDEKIFISEFLLQYYSMRDDVPKKIALSTDIDDADMIEEWLSQKKGKRVYINVPSKGVQKNLVDMCRENSFDMLAQQQGVTGRQLSVLEELKTMLSLETIPEYIESYDISNLSGEDNVAGMIVYENAKPLKSAYKRFKIKSFDGQDDCASMREVITRRLNEYKKSTEISESDDREIKAQNEPIENKQNQKPDKGFARLPDLILLDGGKTQVAAVAPIIKEFELDVPVFGMVKDDNHRTRAIVSTDGEIELKPNRRVFSFVAGIQDEVHRYAITYNRSKRKKIFSSSLEKIDGIGKKRAKELLRYFRTISNIKKATLKELESAPGMNHTAALNVYKYFHGEE